MTYLYCIDRVGDEHRRQARSATTCRRLQVAERVVRLQTALLSHLVWGRGVLGGGGGLVWMGLEGRVRRPDHNHNLDVPI